MAVENVVTQSSVLSPEFIAGLSILAVAGLLLMWFKFWSAVSASDESILAIVSSPSFFKVITVIGVIASTVVLSLAGKLEGNITGAILSGIVGYVLGQLSHSDGENKSNN